MPTSRKKEMEQKISREEIVNMLREILMQARMNHLIFGRLLQGPAYLERLLEDDLTTFIAIVERYIKRSV